MISGGTIGELFTALAFASAFVAMLSFFFAEKQQGLEKKSWERMGLMGFGIHIFSILGIIVTLFLLIYHHRYEYHYVWSHSSNELPIYYMISCFWEGQEGSFLLWCFWHAMLGGILMLTLKSEWRNLVMAVIASVELVLSSMILGIYVGQTAVYGIYLIMVLAPLAVLLYRLLEARNKPETLGAALPLQGSFHLAGVFLALSTLALIFRGQMGFYGAWSWKSLTTGLDGVAFSLWILALCAFGVFSLLYIGRSAQKGRFPLADVGASVVLLTAAWAASMFEADTWKVGSTPFALLKSVFPDNEVYAQNPDFIPSNGTGLNSLLQNYWMVIHPPTLFLGFASTIVPFAFVVAGLIKGKYREWIRPATPWALMSAMVLGIGIIMGGYWAYETLNFGGYWNWDPVENGSLVPWLCGIASLHAMLVHQKTKGYLKLTMVLVISTFLLVLYSTFLTRSGILGDTSVHTFTDLGLSGQLLILLLSYLAGISLLMIYRWKTIPERPDESSVWSAEFMLFLGILVLIFSSAEILLSTSLPVINKLAGTNVAPPAELQLFYYKWNVWFAIAIGALTGMGQFLWWAKVKKKSPSEALFRPFMLAMVLGSLVLIAMTYFDKHFAYERNFAEIIQKDAAFFPKVWSYIESWILASTNELLLFASLFMIFANLDILISLLRNTRKGLKVMGGTIAHLGFGLMLAGMLFSSGYDEIISINITPDELAGFSDQEKRDNVRLFKDRPRIIKDYRVTYLGKKEAVAPIRDLNVIEETAEFFKVRFKDATGDVFGYVLPRPVFLKEQEEDTPHPVANVVGSEELEGELDLQYAEDFLNKNLPFIKPGHINNRKLYGILFEPLRDTSDSFVLYPEAEVNEDMGSIIAHPARRVLLDRDLYVHVSQIPAEEEREPRYDFHELVMQMGDTARLGDLQVFFEKVLNFSNEPGISDSFEIALAANLQVFSPQGTFVAQPLYLIDTGNRFSMKEASIEALHMDFAFYKVNPETEQFFFQVRRQTNPTADFIAFKAIRKPYINLLWLGTFILVAGFLVSIYRRFRENKN